jgi:hypothetical protein
MTVVALGDARVGFDDLGAGEPVCSCMASPQRATFGRKSHGGWLR